MATYKAPGVYVKEVSLFPPSVAEVATAVPAFIGYTQMAKKVVDNDLRLVPTRIKSMVEYKQFFGETDNLSFTVNLVENSTTHNITIMPIDPPSLRYLMHYCMQIYFSNGGGPCYIISVGSMSDPHSLGNDDTGLQAGLKKLEKEDEPTLIVIPEATSLGNRAHFFSLMGAALGQCNKLMDRFAIIDIYNEDIAAFRNDIISNLDEVKYGAAYRPWLRTSLNFAYDEDSVTIGTHVNEEGAAIEPGLAETTLGNDAIKIEKMSCITRLRKSC